MEVLSLVQIKTTLHIKMWVVSNEYMTCRVSHYIVYHAANHVWHIVSIFLSLQPPQSPSTFVALMMSLASNKSKGWQRSSWICEVSNDGNHYEVTGEGTIGSERNISLKHLPSHCCSISAFWSLAPDLGHLEQAKNGVLSCPFMAAMSSIKLKWQL